MEEVKKEPNSQRKKALWTVTASFLLIALALFIYWFKWARFHEYTDDAYVSGNLIYVTPQVTGIITSIYVDNTQHVEEGMLLAEIDETDFKIALDEAKAQLGETVRSVAQMFVQTKQSLAMIEVAKAQLEQKAQDFQRRVPLINIGGVSAEDFDHAKNHFTEAHFSLVAARQNFLSLSSQTDKTTIETHPLVKKAKERVKLAWIQLRRCTLTAPASGLIAQRSMQVGQRVSSGEPLLAVIPLDQMWVDANFKETQIGKMQIGQEVHLNADIYGRSIDYHGRISGIGGGTGSVFSILPPQNATGNWIKIVQRVPIRIILDAQELLEYPLRLGLSMEATVDIHDIGETSIPPIIEPQKLYQTDVFAKELEGVDEVIEQILNKNFSPVDLTPIKTFNPMDFP